LVDNPVKGVGVVIGLYILGTIFFVPGSLLTIGSGYAFT